MKPTLIKQKNKKNEIINATFRCLYEKGAEEVSMRTIAKEAKVNQSTLHYYFQNKENLLTACIQTLFDTFLSDIEKRYRNSDPPEKKLETIFSAGRTFVGKQKELFVILFHCWALSMRNRTMRKAFFGLYNKISGFIDDVLEEGYQKGVFKKIPRDTISNFLIAFMQGSGSQCHMTGKFLNLNKFFELFMVNLKQLIFKKTP
jgi:AcrR family transcriptional regulator